MAENFIPNTRDKKVDDLVSCRICHRYFIDPRLLPCGHTYCLGCIRTEASHTKGAFICPIKDGATIQRNQIESLQVNHAIDCIVRSRLKMIPTPVTNLEPEDSDNSDDIEDNTTGNARNDPYNSHIFNQNVISINGLPSDMPEQRLFNTLWDMFRDVGEMKIDQRTNKPFIHLSTSEVDRSILTGCATITFEREESVVQAIEKYNGKCVRILKNAKIYVEKSEPKKSSSSIRSTIIPSNETDIKAWVQIEGRQATKVTLNSEADIDDLKKVALDEEDDAELYQAYFGNQQLNPGEPVPSNTTSNRPVLLKEISKRQPTGSRGASLVPGVVGQVMLKPSIPSGDSLISTDYHIVIDNSNMFIGCQTIRNKETGLTQTNPAIRVNIKYLVKILEANKLETSKKTRIVGGSKPSKEARVWTEWKSCGYKCILGDRSAAGSEIGIDDMLHAQIYELLHIYKDVLTRPQVLVLVTGDGNRNRDLTSFPITVERVLTSNWSVELWAWEQSLSKKFFDIQKFFPTRMTIKLLDSYREDITFLEKPREN